MTFELCIFIYLFSFFLCRLEGFIRSLVSRNARYEFDIFFSRPSYDSIGFLSQLDSCFPILFYDVSTDVWLTLLTLAFDSIMTACLDVITPADWLANLTFITSYNPDSIFMALFYIIVHYARLVVEYLNAHQV